MGGVFVPDAPEARAECTGGSKEMAFPQNQRRPLGEKRQATLKWYGVGAEATIVAWCGACVPCCTGWRAACAGGDGTPRGNRARADANAQVARRWEDELKKRRPGEEEEEIFEQAMLT